ncbi:MAG: DUF4340 domain-containing protein, partial [Burkholderiales bacterium]
MNRKQFTILIAALVLLGGLVWALKQRDQASWTQSESRVGQTLLKDFSVNNVASIRIKNAYTELNLVKKDDLWRVKERGDYPANFASISDLLLKIQDQKIIQSDAITAEQRPQLELVEPGKGSSGGTLIELSDVSGKTLAKLTLGKRYMRTGQGGVAIPAGRYVMVSGDDNNAALINDALLDSEPKPDIWISRDFVRIDKIKSIELRAQDGSPQWKMFREKEGADWQLSDAKPGDDFDQSRGISATNAISSLNFVDVVTINKTLDTGMATPKTVVVETFDSLIYTLRIGNESSDDNQYIAVAVSGEAAKERITASDEKPDDKARLDKDFKDRQTKLEARLKREKSLTPWTYITPKWRLDPLLKDRAG